jgi:hypothetical protein
MQLYYIKVQKFPFWFSSKQINTYVPKVRCTLFPLFSWQLDGVWQRAVGDCLTKHNLANVCDLMVLISVESMSSAVTWPYFLQVPYTTLSHVPQFLKEAIFKKVTYKTCKNKITPHEYKLSCLYKCSLLKNVIQVNGVTLNILVFIWNLLLKKRIK